MISCGAVYIHSQHARIRSVIILTLNREGKLLPGVRLLEFRGPSH